MVRGGPTKANVADLPSRDPSTWTAADAAVMARIHARIAEQRLGATEGAARRRGSRVLVLPSAAELDDPLVMWTRASAVAAGLGSSSSC